MTKTKKGFLTAGGVLGIINAGLLIISALVLLFCIRAVDVELSTKVINELAKSDASFKDVDVNALTTILKCGCVVFGIICAGAGAAILVLSIKVLKMPKYEVENKGIIIALLVLSFVSASYIVFAFMIVALCLKNKATQSKT